MSDEEEQPGGATPVPPPSTDALDGAQPMAEAEPLDADAVERAGAPGDEPSSEGEAEPEAQPEPEAAPSFRYDDKFYEPVSPDAPAGKTLEHYHFTDMEQELAWPQNEFSRPDPEQRPNFRAVRDMALGFLNGTKDHKATRDIRPFLCLVLAEAGDKGPVGLARALDLFVSFATDHWDAMNPQDEDGDGEFFERMELLRGYFNPAIFSLAVESIGIARSPRVGELTTRTFGIAATKVSPREGEFAPNSDALTALMADEEQVLAGVTEAHHAYRHAIAKLERFAAFLDEKPDLDPPLDVTPVIEALEKQDSFIAPYVGAGGAPASDGADGDSVDVGAGFAAGGDGAGASSAAPSAPVGGANTLEEAMDLIDEVLGFYARRGRSSPVPLGLIALRDLMAGDFNSWISKTASSGLGEAGIVLSEVDASRLSSFASGEAPAAAPPAEMPEFDFDEIDKAIYDGETAYAAMDNALYQHQQTLPPDEGAEENTVLSEELQAFRVALDQILAAKVALQAGPKSENNVAVEGENVTEGDDRHSRITDRNGVKQALDAVAAYFEREEPSSPAPAYLKRLKSLVDARFTEIARELMPEEGGETKLRLEPRTSLR